MVGTIASSNSRFQQASQQASAHYGVDENEIVQWVDEKDAAWTNGNSGVEGATGRNEDSITIEHADNGLYNDPRPPGLYARSGRLIYGICERYRLPINRTVVIGHRECTGNAPTACPDALDVDRLVREALANGVSKEGAVTEREIEAIVINWYVQHAGRWPNEVDETYITDHWVPAWRADPVAAYGEFLRAAAAELEGASSEDMRAVRVFDLAKGAS